HLTPPRQIRWRSHLAPCRRCCCWSVAVCISRRLSGQWSIASDVRSVASIRVKALGKRYEIEPVHRDYPTLRDHLTTTLSQSVRRLLSRTTENDKERGFWALRNVSFEVGRGEVLEVSGPNGAGKSTLLRIVSRIKGASEGDTGILGKTASLLEVGMGFHPELTGRENILLNGAILGISNRDMHRRFEQIVDYAGLAKFIDTSVKRYS